MANHTHGVPGPVPDGGLQISRRSFLRASAVGAGALALGGCGTLGAGITGAPVAPGTVTFWDLFGGGDGVRMADMLAKFQQGHPELGLQHVTLAWGNPYYTKLSLATLGDQPPDVGVSHASRLSDLRRQQPPAGADARRPGQARPDSRQVQREGPAGGDVQRQAVRRPAGHPPLRPLLQHRHLQEGRPARRRRESQVHGRPGRVRAGTDRRAEAGRSAVRRRRGHHQRDRPPTGGSSSRSTPSWAARCWRTTAPRWSWTRPRRSRCSTTCGT